MVAQLNLFGPQIATGDAQIEDVAEELVTADPEGHKVGRLLRRTYDMLLDGQHTGRYRWEQLSKTEKTHFGTLAEINVQRAFGFADGEAMDFAIRGIDVDCKFSQDPGDWMIPPEAVGQILLGLWASDDRGLWSLGLIRATDQVLTSATGNRDRKRWLSPVGKAAISWLYRNRPLPENALLRIPPRDVDQIFGCSEHGAGRVDMLFRLAQRRIISRTVVATVAQQDDYMRRVRSNGGSRGRLRREGIVIFGDYHSHRHAARQLGLAAPTPESGESVSVRLARQRPHHEGLPSISLGGERWVVALPTDPTEDAPLLPGTKA